MKEDKNMITKERNNKTSGGQTGPRLGRKDNKLPMDKWGCKSLHTNLYFQYPKLEDAFSGYPKKDIDLRSKWKLWNAFPNLIIYGFNGEKKIQGDIM